MDIDILAFGAHPDDVEMSASGLLLQEKHRGKTIGIVDLTAGELGTRGSATLRKQESQKASQLLGLQVRHNLEMADGFFKNDKDHQMEVIKIIRHHRPSVVLANAISDRHPDHGKAAQLVRDAFFLAGLKKIETIYEGKQQEAFRPSHLIHYIQDMQLPAHFYVDISAFWKQKKEIMLAYGSQFYDPNYHAAANEPQTYISTSNFLEAFEARHIHYGKMIGVAYAEGYQVVKPIGVSNLSFLLSSMF